MNEATNRFLVHINYIKQQLNDMVLTLFVLI